ncbi:Concanavalin A-like lectin protein kinase family protein [Theobroma cacao]|uniref:Concanavalin A-like lectin protein kinase family protein n=1 Tax=Theobroma cacao TaxID=3641 RepID=A0A061DHC7_THECC|nr:Concanavalin A-like lectin protein kinase family protein [Theobroma cacao]
MAAGLYNLFYLPFIFAFFLLVFPSVNSVNFQISRFEPNDDRILYQGEASPSDEIINFNSLDILYRVGWVTYANRVPLWEPKTGKLSDFSTRFAFSININNLSDYGHGFVFFLAPAGSQIPPNSAAGRLGLFNTSQWVSTLGQVVLVEFDTYKNGWDPDQLDNHVGINNNSIVSAVYTRWNASIHNGDTADVLITYNATTKNLSASWSYRATNNPQENSSLRYQIDIMKALPEWVMVGFSAATEQRKLGEGGFGAVYRGYLPDLDMVVAVKRISRRSKQGKKEYVTEVKVISQLRHRNLVQLIGWCHDRSELILVYEFMPNGSLDFHLFGQKFPLSWPVSFNVKLGDFGLARLMDHELGPKTTGLAGTLGYLAPEYVSTGRASKESDVYSFGVVLLEIATGRKSIHRIEKFEMGLVAWVWDLYGQGKLPLAVDEKLNKEVDEKQVECLMIVGLWSAHPDSSSRPSIRQAIQVLNFDIEKPNLLMKMPVPTYLVPTQLVTSQEPLLTNSSMEVGR